MQEWWPVVTSGWTGYQVDQLLAWHARESARLTAFPELHFQSLSSHLPATGSYRAALPK